MPYGIQKMQAVLGLRFAEVVKLFVDHQFVTECRKQFTEDCVLPVVQSVVGPEAERGESDGLLSDLVIHR